MRALQRFGITFMTIGITLGAAVGTAKADILLEERGALAAGDAILEDGSWYDQYTFSADGGQQITISLMSQDFDPYLILLDPQGRRISENDDISLEDRNSQLVIVLPNTGTYTVVANSYESGKDGAYEIKIEK
ncbi:MAG: PPC domain-containing protein [Phormidesmis sp.]